MAKVVKIPTDSKELKKFVKACAKEIQLIVNPTDKATKEPIEVAKGSVDKMKEKIIACSKTLTAKDELSKELAALLADLGIEIPEDDDAASDNESGSLPTKDDIDKMKSKELKELNKKEKLGVKVTGLKIPQLREEIWKAIAAQAGGEAGFPDEDALDDMDFDELEDLVKENDTLSDEIDMDDFDEDGDDDEGEDALRSAILQVIADQAGNSTPETDGGEMPEVPEVDEDDPDDPDETHEALAKLVEEHDLDIAPDDFDEDEEDEVNDFREKVVAALGEKFDDSPTSDAGTDATEIPEMPDKADIDDDSEDVHEALANVIKAAGLSIDPEDFDEEDEDEVLDLFKKVTKALKKMVKSGGKKDKVEKKEPSLADTVKEAGEDFKALKKMVKGNDTFAKLNDADKLKKFKKDPAKLAAKMIKLAEKATTDKTKDSGKKKDGETKLNQTQLIRDMISDGSKRKKIVKAIVEKCDKTPGQAESRMKAYEKQYGEMGADDPKLK